MQIQQILPLKTQHWRANILFLFFILFSLDFEWSDILQFGALDIQHFKKYFSCFHFLKWILPWPSVPSELHSSHFSYPAETHCFNSITVGSSGWFFAHFFLFNYVMLLLLSLCKHPLDLLQFDFLSRIGMKKRKWWTEKIILGYILFAILITALWIWTR